MRSKFFLQFVQLPECLGVCTSAGHFEAEFSFGGVIWDEADGFGDVVGYDEFHRVPLGGAGKGVCWVAILNYVT